MSPAPVRVWDLPIRLFHWAIVLLIPALWWTQHVERLDLHILLGETMLALVLFRLIWGVIGGSTARFATFVRGPATVLRYLRGETGATVGHTPLGALSVVAMLALLAVQVGLGLFVSDEDGLNTGPLSHLVSYDSARTLAARHETMFWILLAFIVLHVAAIFFYLFARRNNLIGPMVTGSRAPVAGSDEALVAAPWWRLAIAAAAAVGLTWAIVALL